MWKQLNNYQHLKKGLKTGLSSGTTTALTRGNREAILSGTVKSFITGTAASYGEDAAVYESNDLKLSSNSLPNVGFDPLAVGRIFSLESGQTSEPFATENGVIIAQMVNLTKAPEVADYSSFSEAVKTVRANNTSQKITSLIEREADIEDKRYKVY